jgi:hypothetical protein
MRSHAPLIAALLLTATPVATGQDFLRQFETMVEGLTAPITPPRRPAPRPTPPAPETAQSEDAEAPEPPPIPRPRPEGLGEDETEEAPETGEEPQDSEDEAAPEETEADDAEPAEEAPADADEAAEDDAAQEPEPEPEPEPEEPARIYQSACPALLRGQIEATLVAPISKAPICGEVSPLSVTGVLANGRMVPLSSPATLNCEMATGLVDWVEALEGHIEATTDSRLAAIETSTSYFCRPRNNIAGADTSEHGFANALDVTALLLEDGQRISVLEDWPDEDVDGRVLRFAHGAACSIFTTVLGPEANAAHEDHFHLDLGCHGGSCTSRLCE